MEINSHVLLSFFLYVLFRGEGTRLSVKKPLDDKISLYDDT